MAQLLAHHASNGCNLRPGDLLATAPSPGRQKMRVDACWNSPPAARSRLLCPAASGAASSKMARKSSCADIANAKARRGSASASAEQSCCRPHKPTPVALLPMIDAAAPRRRYWWCSLPISKPSQPTILVPESVLMPHPRHLQPLSRFELLFRVGESIRGNSE